MAAKTVEHRAIQVEWPPIDVDRFLGGTSTNAAASATRPRRIRARTMFERTSSTW